MEHLWLEYTPFTAGLISALCGLGWFCGGRGNEITTPFFLTLKALVSIWL